MSELRPYQQKALEDLRESLRTGHRRPLLVMPTGSGKTHVAGAMIRSAVDKGNTVMVLAPRRELVYQTCDHLHDAGVEHSVLMAGHHHSIVAPVQVVSIPTLYKRLEDRTAAPPFAQLLFIDEAHLSISPSTLRVLGEYADRPVVGMTATPARKDGRGLGGVYDDLIEGPSVRELMDAGHLVPANYYCPSEVDLAGIKMQAGDYNQRQLGNRMNDPVLIGDTVTEWCRICPDRSTVVFAVNVEHSKHLTERFRDVGVAAEHLDATTPLDERRGIFARVRSGETQVVCNVDVYCLDDQTEILTRRGWAGIDDIEWTDDIANWSEGVVRFTMPDDIIKRPRRPGERMVTMETRQRSIRVTESHLMLYRTKRGGGWQKDWARNLVGRRLELPVNGQQVGPGVPLTIDECWFVGFWLGDGSASKNPSGSTVWSVSQALCYPRIIDKFDEVVVAVAIDCRRRVQAIRGNGHDQVRWTFPRGTGHGAQQRHGVEHLRRYLDKVGGDWILDLSRQQFMALLEGLHAADGLHGQDWELPRASRIACANESLMTWMQMGCVVNGVSARLTKLPSCQPGHSDQWSLYFNTGKVSRQTGRPQDGFQFEEGWREERVWCVSVPDKNIIARRNGIVTVMGNTYGVDIPRLSCCVIARPTKSLVRYLQGAGRVLRPAEGKEDTIIIDHGGVVDELGFVDDERAWHLGDGPASLPKARQPTVKQPAAITCPECKCIFRARPICPSCGKVMGERYQRAISAVDRELEQVVDRDERRPADWSDLEKRQFFMELVSMGWERGYKPGWPGAMYKERFGEWPPREWRSFGAKVPTPKTRSWVKSRQIAYYKRKQKEEKRATG